MFDLKTMGLGLWDKTTKSMFNKTLESAFRPSEIQSWCEKMGSKECENETLLGLPDVGNDYN